ncbi:endolytic transglycosylase MltG [Breoghania sp.]|uniref:endolytic transglycosylase MltG n=1 Tax=Breoghania sp. TaxID=2065378 RepID=UPI0029C9F466|nr:endolytic transglycosylase MltG [Breoghania sp.]
MQDSPDPSDEHNNDSAAAGASRSDDAQYGEDVSDTPMRLTPKSPREAIQPERVPELPPRSRHARNGVVVFLNFILTFAVLGALAVGGLLYWGKVTFDSSGPLTKETAVVVTPGSGLESISNLLARNDVIEQPWVFMGGVQLYKNASKLKAGEYLFPAGISMNGVMNMLVEGKAIQHAITIPEGWTSAQIVERIKEDPVLVGELNEVPVEGALLPETYAFTRGTTRKEMIERMRVAQDKALAEIWARRSEGLPVKTPEELVTLASIVEKETGKADERPRVAGVFVNRLNKNWRLESDPTILYGLYGGDAWTRSRSIRKSEKEAPNRYNTYQIRGLPPGPIANPGRKAMEAVANPSRTKDMFFVADGTGGHLFAETIQQHNRNVSRWREVERNRQEEAKAAREAEAAEAAKAAKDAAEGDVDDLAGSAPSKTENGMIAPAAKPEDGTN